jgi:hypothetical protein
MFIIPALNLDVGTYDNMSVALHYLMFQMVVVANNGTYGGSNAYFPFDKPFTRQLFHLHGQPQASIAFFELDAETIESVLQRKSGKQKNMKYPPAGARTP